MSVSSAIHKETGPATLLLPAVALVLLACGDLRAQGLAPQLSEVETDVLLVGQGFNSITGQQRAQSVVYNDEKDLVVPGGGSGSTVKYTLQTIDSFEQLKQTLNLNAAASFGFGIF
jgi:hypothetical protein